MCNSINIAIYYVIAIVDGTCVNLEVPVDISTPGAILENLFLSLAKTYPGSDIHFIDYADKDEKDYEMNSIIEKFYDLSCKRNIGKISKVLFDIELSELEDEYPGYRFKYATEKCMSTGDIIVDFILVIDCRFKLYKSEWIEVG